MTLPKVLVADSISQRGVEELSRDDVLEVLIKTGLSEEELLVLIPDFAGLVVRSQTKVTAEILNAGVKLRVVGRAGVGVDNVDVETATRRGIVVLNAPGGNTISTAEHAFSLLLSVARKIPPADANVRSKKWDKKNFEGVELYNKTLAVVGMGRIGSELSRRAIAFGMRVMAYDPYLSATRARSLQVELVDELDELLKNADFISLHTPFTPETRHILDSARLAKTKRGVRIINCARGGLIDESALVEALQDGQVAGAALDVFEIEPLPSDSPLRSAPNVVLTPHLGASTAEAQESVGIEIAQSIRAVLLEGTIRNAVNMPNLDAKTLAVIGPHLRFGEKLGRCLSQLGPKRAESININYSGKVNEVDTTAITRAVLKGFLQIAGGSEINEVNAPAFAETLGLEVSESRLSAPGDYTDMLELSATGEGRNVSVGGAFFGATPRIVSINSRPVEARPHGVVLVLENTDRPGMVGRIGTLLGEHGVNIATMSLSRNQAGGTALTVLNLDTAPSEELLKDISASEDIHAAQVIQL
ncbi:MAG TPA: phosphoglycerate dehydrogenase [Candidatus Udaeobacter sp.]|nr:phosphoglycerate dehydrogenase [Candidatus Udaeobacter sp.]